MRLILVSAVVLFAAAVAEGQVPMPPAPKTETYKDVRVRVANGGSALIAVGVPCPDGYTLVTDVPAGVPAGLYSCWFDGVNPKMQRMPDQTVTLPAPASAVPGLLPYRPLPNIQALLRPGDNCRT